jgi:RNA polymerase sigma-70 factor (ECF subfamily)
MKHLSDEELMSIVQAGDFSPASELYDRYSGRIYNFASRFLKNSESGEDATQEVFVKMIKHANQFHGGAKFSTWLFSIARNQCRDYLRKAENKVKKEGDDVLITLPAPAELSPHRNLERQEDKKMNEKIIQEALMLLPPDQREIVLLSRFQGLTYAEIAQVAGCSEGAVKAKAFKAIDLLRKVFAGDSRGGNQCLNVV